jgi:hypothetical protein
MTAAAAQRSLTFCAFSGNALSLSAPFQATLSHFSERELHALMAGFKAQPLVEPVSGRA